MSTKFVYLFVKNRSDLKGHKIHHKILLAKFIFKMEVYSEIGVKDLAIKARSKKEVYSLLVTEGGIYLPPLADAHYKYISKVIVGDNKYLKSKDVKVWQVPQIKGLKISHILEFARAKVDIDSYLPDYQYRKEPNRAWICNVINSLHHRRFPRVCEFKNQRTSEACCDGKKDEREGSTGICWHI